MDEEDSCRHTRVRAYRSPVEGSQEVFGLAVWAVAVEPADTHVDDLVEGPAPDRTEEESLVGDRPIPRPVVQDHDSGNDVSD